MTTLLALLLVFALPVFAGAGQTIRVGYEQNHPIASTANDGTAQGIMVDVIQEVARREGWTMQFVPRIWQECLDNLEAGRIDLLVGIAYTPERAEKYSFNKHEYME
jgi:ABC-type amino acid transport substrate-binding protein